MAIDYAVSTVVEYWFNQEFHDGLFEALVHVIKERGFAGLATSLLQNFFDSPSVEFLATFANYFITTPYEVWDPVHAFVDASMTALLRSFVDIAFVKGLGFTKIEKLLADFAIWPQGFNVMEEFFLDRRVIKAWKELADRPDWVRLNSDLLKKLAGKDEAFIKKLNDFYASTSHKLPPGWKNDPNLQLPQSYLGIEYDKFGFPRLEVHVSNNSHVVKIVMDGSNDDYIRAYDKLKGIVGESNIQFTNSFGSSFKIRQNGQWSNPYTWHHHQDGESMMPVIQTVHQSIQNYHTGGRSIFNNGLVGLFDSPQL